ncbi:MAG: hypothetical protein KG003_13815 [Bacteroidetes bacterium]|nr:hypothetical protein [Bacteroidota bacterium]
MNGVVIIQQDELEQKLEEVAGRVLDRLEFSRPKPREVMTLAQLADFWQVNKQSILNWMNREPDDNPLPVDYVGSDPRFFYSEIREWSGREKERKFAAKKQKIDIENDNIQ